MLALTCALLAWPHGSARASETECLAAIAVLEAGSEGRTGMEAVIQVVRNRIRDGRFPGNACAVIAQPRQFQPVSEWPALAQALRHPANFRSDDLLRSSKSLRAARQLARIKKVPDPTGGALYFVNPRFMDPAYCPWFATLKHTKSIGNHEFMTHYRRGEKKGPPALDCSSPEIGSRRGSSLANQYANGLFHPSGARIASRTPTRNQLQAWKKTGRLEQRQRELKKLFKPGWIELD
ncbi:MAG: cell wall hydrolase [Geminicoccaceae bacterium]